MFDETADSYDWRDEHSFDSADPSSEVSAQVIEYQTFTRGGVSTAWIEAGMPQIMVDRARLSVAWMPTATLTSH